MALPQSLRLVPRQDGLLVMVVPKSTLVRWEDVDKLADLFGTAIAQGRAAGLIPVRGPADLSTIPKPGTVEVVDSIPPGVVDATPDAG